MNVYLRSVIGRKDLTNVHKCKYQGNNTCAVMFVLIFFFSPRDQNIDIVIVTRLFQQKCFVIVLEPDDEHVVMKEKKDKHVSVEKKF